MMQEKIFGISFNSKSDMDASLVAEILKTEVMKSCSPSEYTSIWHLQAPESVTRRKM